MSTQGQREARVIRRAADAVEHYREWSTRVAELMAPHVERRRRVHKAIQRKIGPEPVLPARREEGESKADFATRKSDATVARKEWRERRVREAPDELRELKQITKLTVQITKDNPQPPTADDIVEEIARGDVYIWQTLINRVSDELRSRGVFETRGADRREEDD